MKAINQTRMTTIVFFVVLYSFMNLICGCESNVESPAKTIKTCQCVQTQHLVVPPDTILLWQTDTITLDSMSVHYGFLYCGIDTVAWTPDSIVFNQMKCWN